MRIVVPMLITFWLMFLMVIAVTSYIISRMDAA